jgi:hypothetical protein
MKERDADTYEGMVDYGSLENLKLKACDDAYERPTPTRGDVINNRTEGIYGAEYKKDRSKVLDKRARNRKKRKRKKRK